MKTKIKSQDIEKALNKMVASQREQYGSYAYSTGFLLQMVVRLSDNLEERTKEVLIQELERTL